MPAPDGRVGGRPRAPGSSGGKGMARTTRRRIVAMLLVSTLGLTAVVLRLTQVQAMSASRYEKRGVNQRVRTVTLAAERGSIFDRNGTDLALSVSEETVWANPRVVDDPAGYAAKLAPILKMDEKTLKQRLSKRPSAFVYLARKVDSATAEEVRRLQLPGVDFVPESKRFYPSGSLAGPLLGTVGLDNQGLAGLEVQHDKALSGRPGELTVERDPTGRRIPQGLSRLSPATRGADLVLTVDQSLQYEVERALVEAVTAANAKGGTAVVEDIRTGAVLAMANVVGAMAGSPARPANGSEKNRAVTDVYEPGSTNKVITMAGALEEAVVTPETRFKVPDKLAVGNHVFSDHEPHPPIDWSVTDILVNSSNIGTITVAQKLGKERLDRYLRAFGFGDPTGVGFPGEASGLLLDPGNWYVTSMGTVPIGNGLAVSALQMLQVYVAIANGGVWRPPQLVGATIDAEGKRKVIEPAPTRRVVSTRTAEQLNEMMRKVVAEGTGTKAAIPGYSVAGKTGTARKPLEGARGYSGQYVASFVGYVPADAPRLAAAVVLDEPIPIYGGQVAAPVFSRIMQYALRLDRIPPPAPPPGAVPAPGVTPEADGPTPVPGDLTPPTTAASKPAVKPAASSTSTTRKSTTTTRKSTTTTTRKSTTTTRKSTTTTSTTTPPRRASAENTSSTRPSTTTTTRPTTSTTRPKNKSSTTTTTSRR
jgi:cell division protein FtsI (penicillin-binding protein 3)